MGPQPWGRVPDREHDTRCGLLRTAESGGRRARAMVNHQAYVRCGRTGDRTIVTG